MRTVNDVACATAFESARGPCSRLPAPEYREPADAKERCRVGFGVESMRRHTTNEGWELFEGLRHAGYYLALGNGLHTDDLPKGDHLGWILHHTYRDVSRILGAYDPAVVVVQDKREWTGRTAGPGFDDCERFENVDALQRSDAFRVTILKDAHSDQFFHREAAEEIGCHAWVVYYHPRIVAAQAPFVRPEHLVRTWHTVDADIVPPFKGRPRDAGLVSGAVSRSYPLRTRLVLEGKSGRLKYINWMAHPGYGRAGCHTPNYLKVLSEFKVAICTSSRFGYAVRKIVEATAAGCVVVTDLPSDDVLPEIDGNLVRVDPDTSPRQVDELVGELASRWDADLQREWSDMAKAYYDYRVMGRRLAADIEALRRRYP